MSTDVEQIKERLNIVDVISGYLKVEKAGVNYKARCPFHNEKTPSFFISSTRQSFYCFGCGEKGDVFSFVQKIEGFDFKDALKVLAEKAGVELKKFETNEKIEEKDKFFEVLEKTTKIYEENLKGNEVAKSYLKNRGLTESSIIKWRIGLAEDAWRNLHDALLLQKFSKENMLQTGLIKKAVGTEGTRSVDKYYDTFRNRIMFPIGDNVGKTIAFSGRALKEDDKTPKYLNSPETKLFYKSEVLYGFNVAKNHIRKLDYTVLVEGQMDLVMSHQAGVLNTVASSGTALTELHLKKIQKLSNRVVIAYDCDSAGQKAARKAAEMALTLGMEVKIAVMPEGEDPASVVQNDPQKWLTALKESEYFLDFVLEKTFKENKDRNLTREILKNVLPLALLVKSEIEKSQFIKKIAQKIKVNEDAVWNDLNKIAKEKSGKIEKIEEEIENKRDKKEELLLEAEKFGLTIDVEKINKEIAKNTEIKELKRRRQEITIMLDDKISKEEKNKLEEDLKNLEKRYKEINN